ncbi:unnamed protein product (macronuclear) [Paramecium tetraurelia]|uniref:Uncharacterized protein n=1 Tax=Paramecium tetraurelia TaxID=5888 RepID=A0CC76_PARTE|nr:uncharacterized protein GSPATT00037177001 [Paramecium tetraurelia]CAK68393.1 unnamed protein product [Paramecium tetraurelia]|eukprot:XP_001435790.1 hypothetical protein (macronuclear) [Paramecium tetraurelia strain d4-2]
MKSKLDSSHLSKSSGANDSRILKQTYNPLFKIYHIDTKHILCKSCKMLVLEKEAYKHLYDDQHVHILQKEFLRNKIKSESNHRRREVKSDIKQKSFSQQSMKKQSEKGSLNKSRDSTIGQFIKSHQQFVSKLVEDLNLIGHSNLSLVVALLSETQCKINMIYELNFSKISEQGTCFVIQQNKQSQPSYSINKQRMPEFLQQFLQKNLGSNKSIMDWKSRNKCTYLRYQIQQCCKKLAKLTKNKDYQKFLIGIRLSHLKGLGLQQQNDLNKQLQAEETGKVQIMQQNEQEQESQEENPQLLGDQKKSNIRIVFKKLKQEN